MGDFDNAVMNAKNALDEGREIDDATARVIASMYHEGQSSITYSFASTGFIADRTDVYRECFSSYESLSGEEKLLAGMFGTYLLNRASCDAVNGWSKLWV